MYTNRQFPFRGALRWSSRIFPWIGSWAVGLTSAHILLDLEWLQLPALPVGVLGTAVAFYLGFKGNAAYGRLWEARKIWGGIVNTSRTWGVYATTLVTDLHRDTPGETALADEHRALVYRHVAWLEALRTQLRRRKAWEHQDAFNDERRKVYDTLDNSDEVIRARIAPFVDEAELEAVMAQKNKATQLVRLQGEHLERLMAEHRIDDFRHMRMVGILEELYTLQGKCERIKNFPLPRQYATVNRWFVWLFIGLLPLAMLGSFHDDSMPEAWTWLTIPVSMLIGWVFYMWDLVVDYSENPFEGLVNDIPMTALSRTIEIDLREMLGETELPPPVTPIEGFALM